MKNKANSMQEAQPIPANQQVKPEKREKALRARTGPAKRIDWQEVFLKALIQIPDITRACYAARVSTATAYRYREQNEEFRKAWKDALRDGLEAARGELFNRAVTGWQEPVYQQGKKVGSIVKKSDTCLLFLLKTHMPEVYGDKNKLEHSGSLTPGGLPFETPEETMAAAKVFEASMISTLRAAAGLGTGAP